MAKQYKIRLRPVDAEINPGPASEITIFGRMVQGETRTISESHKLLLFGEDGLGKRGLRYEIVGEIVPVEELPPEIVEPVSVIEVKEIDPRPEPEPFDLPAPSLEVPKKSPRKTGQAMAKKAKAKKAKK